MSLFDSASLVVTPNGTKASKLYSIIPTDGSGDLTVTRATTATRVNSAGLIESVANNVPRLDYLNSTCPSILVEPQRTNLLTYSEGNLSTYDISANCTNASPSINGFSNSIQVPSTGTTYFYKTATTTLSQVYTLSCFIKMDDNSAPVLGVNSSLGNLSFVAKGNIAPDNLKVTLIGNNIYRISATTVGNGTPGYFGIVRYSSQTLKTFKISGIQLELGSYATSYIPTTTAAVTRNADVISKSAITSLIGQTEGTMFIDTNIDNISAQINEPVLLYAKGTSSAFIEITPAGLIGAYNNGSTFTGLVVWTTSLQNGRHKFAFAYKNNDFVLYSDGVQVGTDTSGSVSGTLTSFGFQYDVSQYIGRQNINASALWKTRLTNAELAQLTTI
jgi:hypothetical protein